MCIFLTPIVVVTGILGLLYWLDVLGYTDTGVGEYFGPEGAEHFTPNHTDNTHTFYFITNFLTNLNLTPMGYIENLVS